MAEEGVPDGAVECSCPNCGVSLVVFPSTVLRQVSEKTRSVEHELDFASSLVDYRDETERRFLVADVSGDFTCPACQTRASVTAGG